MRKQEKVLGWEKKTKQRETKKIFQKGTEPQFPKSSNAWAS